MDSRFQCSSSGGFSVDLEVEDPIAFKQVFWSLELQKDLFNLKPDTVQELMAKYRITHIREIIYGPCSKLFYTVTDNEFVWA